MGIKRTLLRGFAAGVATVALIAGGASAASALKYEPTPSANGQTLAVVSSNPLAAGTYRVGICTEDTFAPFNAPACGAMVDVVHPGGELLRTTTPAVYQKGNKNAHFGMPGQYRTFNCDVASSCDVVIVKHEGRRSVTIEKAPLAFS